MSDHPVLREAEFDRSAIKKYYIWQPAIAMACTIVLIPLIPVVVLVVFLIMDKFINRLGCTLTARTLEIRKGLFNRVESTVPLEKVTDLQMYQGPIMRRLGLHGFKVETAGQTSGGAGGSLVNMLGIVEAPAFRKAVLAQRDLIAEGGAKKRVVTETGDEINEAKVLVEIRDAMLRIEKRLDKTEA